MPTMSVADFMGGSQKTPQTQTSMRSEEESRSIIDQMEQSTGKTLDEGTRQQMLTDLQNGASLNLPGLVSGDSKAHKLHHMSASDFMGTSAEAETPDQPQSFMDALQGTRENSLNSLKRVYEGIKDYVSDDSGTLPGRKMTPEEFDVYKKLGYTSNAKSALEGLTADSVDDLMPAWGEMSGTPSAKTLADMAAKVKANPEMYKDKPGIMDYLAGKLDSQGFTDFLSHLDNPNKLILENSLPSNFIQTLANSKDKERFRYDQVQSILNAQKILKAQDKYTPKQVAAAQDVMKDFEQKIGDSKKSTLDHLKEMKEQVVKHPAEAAAGLVNALVQDPELLGAGSLVGRGAKLANRIVTGGLEGAAINATISAAQQGKDISGNVDEHELGSAAILGLGMGATLNILKRGKKAYETDINKAKMDGTYEEILRARAAHDAVVEDALKQNSKVPNDVKKRIEESLGIQSKADREKYLAQRRKEVKDAFKNESDYADYLQYLAEEKQTRHELYMKDLEDARKRHAAEESKAAEVDKAYEDARAEARLRRQKEFEDAVAARDEALRAKDHEAALAENDRIDNLRREAEHERLEDVYGQNHPVVRNAKLAAERSDRAARMPKWQRGSVDPELLKQLGLRAGLITAGSAAGAYLYPENRKAGAILGGAAGLLLPAGGEGVRYRRGQSGAIGGLGARTADFGRLKDADALLKAGKSADEIYDQTGWYQGVDGKWKFEIPDDNAPLKPDGINAAKRGKPTTVGDVIDHPELFKAYPDIKNLKVKLKPMPLHHKGETNGLEITLNSDPKAYIGKGVSGSIRSVLLHEIQHTIQVRENFARGGIADEFLSDPIFVGASDDFKERVSHSLYRSLAGEVEARNVQGRAFGSNRRPFETEDLRPEQQQVKFYGDKSSASDLPENNKLQNEQELVSRAKGGDQKAFTKLYNHFAPQLKRFATSYVREAGPKLGVDAGELAHIALAKGLMHLDQFSGDSSLSTWLHAVLKNEGLQLIRTGQSRIDTTSMFVHKPGNGPGSLGEGHILEEGNSSGLRAGVEERMADIETPDAIESARETEQMLNHALRKVPENTRQAVKMFLLDGMSQEEIAQAMGIPQQTVSTLVFRGKKVLQETIEKELGTNRNKDVTPVIRTKIVDAQGKPVPMYHGTPNGDFESFSLEHAGINSDHPSASLGIFFSKDKNVANDYAHWNGPSSKSKTIPVFLNIKNPIHFKDIDTFYDWVRDHVAYEGAKKVRQELINRGYDGIIVGDMKEVAAFHPEQVVRIDTVKKAVNNRYRQAGNIDPALLKKMAAAGIGAGIGAWLNKKHPIWGALLGAGAGLVLRGRKDAFDDLDKAIMPMSTRIKNKSEAVHFRLKEYYRVRNTATHDLIEAGAPFLQALHKLPKHAQALLERSILTGDRSVTDKLIDAIGNPQLRGGWEVMRTVLDGLGDKLLNMKMIKEKNPDYFPRIVKDKEGLFAAIGKDVSEPMQKMLEEANREALKKTGNPLTELEQSDLINKYLSKNYKGGMSQRPGYSFARRFEEIPEELQPFYANLAESYHSYVRGAVKNIELAKFFGKNLVNKEEGGINFPDLDKSIGQYVNEEIKAGKMSSDDVKEISDQIRAMFGNFEKSGNKTLQGAKNVTLAGYLGNPFAAVAQVTTPIVTTYLQGIRPTVEGLVRKLTGKQIVSAKDFGLADHMSEEFVGTTRSAKFLRNALKWGTFRASDLFDKDIKLNAAVVRARKLAKTENGLKQLEAKYKEGFGDRFSDLVEELKKNKLGENTKALAYGELSRSDPIDSVEFSQFYADNPNGRNLLALKSYMLKQMDLFRRDVYNEIKKGNKAKGIRNAMALSLVLGLSGMATEDVKNFMLGRKIKFQPSDLFVNMLKTFGWSEYASRKAFGETKPTRKNPTGQSKAKQQLFQTLGEIVAPPIPYQAMDDLWNRDPRAVAMIPVFGRALAEYYRNKNKTPAQRKKEAQEL